MTHQIAQTRRSFLAAAGALALSTGAGLAMPRKYGLTASASSVGFIYTLSGAAQKGTMPTMTVTFSAWLRAGRAAGAQRRG